MIPFNKPFLHGKELVYIAQAVATGKISGDGLFTEKCHSYFESKFGFKKALLTTSCTDALEMAAILLNIKQGDEVIAPSYTFVSTVNAFILRGAKIIFADSCKDNPNIDPDEIERLVNHKTKAIVVVHYAGIACDMDRINQIAASRNIPIIEDAAQAIDSFHNGRPLGSLGLLGAFSFHETKNIIAGEGGMLAINDEKLFQRAEIIREKGTNRSAFFRGEVDKYGWVDVGSSFLPSDITAAYLFAQLENIENIQLRRRTIWNRYLSHFSSKLIEFGVRMAEIPAFATNNAHMFYLVTNTLEERTGLISYLKKHEINAVFHYQSLHQSVFAKKTGDVRKLENCERFSDCLVRLPLYYDLTDEQVDIVANRVIEYFNK